MSSITNKTLKDTNIILIGPSGAGKSTTGKLLADKLGMTWLELDDLRWAYYDELGYDKDKAKQLRREHGFVVVVAYWQPFSIHALERVLEDHPVGCVISTGAGAVIHDNPDFAARAKKALAPYPFVVQLSPSADIEEAIRICNARIVADNPEMADTAGGPLAVNAEFIRRGDYHMLATITIYNAKLTPDETCAAVVEAIEKESA